MNKYISDIEDKLISKLKKLVKKDKLLYLLVHKKIIQIAENPYLGKPLKNVLKGKRRVHIGHFVLIYELKENKIIFLDFKHHDNVY